MSYVSTVLADSPIAYWRMEEPSGSTVADLSANHFTGTLQSNGWTRNVPSATAALGVGITFPGTTGNYVSVPDNVLLDSLSNCTYEAWIRPAVVSGVTQFFMGKDFNSVGSNQDQMAMGINSGGQLRAVVTWNGTTVVIGSTLVVGTWYHTVVTRAGNPGTWTLYLNAVLQDTEANTHPLVDSDAPFTIGSLLPTENNFPFSGTIDEVAVYGTALSAARVQAHYDARNSAAGGGIPTKTPPGQIVSIMAHDRNAERKQQDQQVPPSRRRVRLDYRRKRGG